MNILIVEDDELTLIGLTSFFKSYGKVNEYTQGSLALKAMEREKFDVALIDLDLEEELMGLTIVQEAKARGIYPVVLTGREERGVVLNAYEMGAKDYLVKPFDASVLENVIHRYLFDNKIKSEKAFFKSPHLPPSILEDLKSYSFSKSPLLILGETGTGKTELAKNIYELLCDLYDDQLPFVFLNCAEFNEGTIESQLFGHKRGAFTGAISDHRGCFEQADGGVLFLDEVGSLPYSTQSKLLRVLEDKKVRPIGSEVERDVNFILLSATCDDLKELIKSGDFRKDLYMRLSGQEVELKSFKNLPNFKKHEMISEILKSQKRRVILSDEAIDMIAEHRWEGNLRELKHFLEKLCSKAQGLVTKSDIDFNLIEKKSIGSEYHELVERVKEFGLPRVIEDIESYMINYFYKENNNKARKTIDDLKISNNSFYKYIKKGDK